MYQQCDNDILLFDEAHFRAMEFQALSWKPRNMTSICYNFFAINENLLVNLVDLQMLWCTICKSRQAYGNILN
jgi:hypothetical protein